jgi:GxxExxY protein
MFLYEDLTSRIIGRSYEVMNELGAGFLESVYHKSLFLALQQEGFCVQFEHPLAVLFRGHNVGNFKVDLLVEKKVIVEVKAIDNITGEHKAQVINYLSASELLLGLIINFAKQKVQTSRLEHPKEVNNII